MQTCHCILTPRPGAPARFGAKMECRVVKVFLNIVDALHDGKQCIPKLSYYTGKLCFSGIPQKTSVLDGVSPYVKCTANPLLTDQYRVIRKSHLNHRPFILSRVREAGSPLKPLPSTQTRTARAL